MLDKAILAGKEHREPYYGSKKIDPTCRNHGSCPWCQENRNYKNIINIQRMNDQEKDYLINS